MKNATLLSVALAVSLGPSGSWGQAQGPAIGTAAETPLTRFIHIPGPNPILRPDDEKAWDGGVIESCDVFKDGTTYFLFYHGTPANEKRWPRKGYRTGVATAVAPLGPWQKHKGNPILDLGPKGSWEDCHVACATILKEEEKRYYLWYSGCAQGQHPKWSVGLATASSPLGPWTKYQGNPVLEDFGYVGGVVKVNRKYYLYSTHPIGATSPDQGPMCLATADKPEGPWTKWQGNPVLPAGDWGAWDDGGYSEAKVLYHEGIFHWFYSGTKWSKRESIGYAYSFDGLHFTKYSGNPIGMRERNPDASAFSEVHALYEPPFVYAFHTLRYKSKPGEDLGVQIFATQTPFRLDMLVLSRETLGPRMTTSLADSPPVCLSGVEQLALTAECAYGPKATSPIRVHVRSSYDGANYDTSDLYSFDNDFKPGEVCRKTMGLETKVRFLKVLVENLDRGQGVSKVKITATLGG